MITRNLATPAALIAVGLATSACDVNYTFGDGDGVPLSELDMGGAAPTELVLAGPDTVEITEGDQLSIAVEGSEEAKDHIRFKLEDGSLAIMRDSSSWDDSDKATIRVTMPAAKALTIAGSGLINATALASSADITIAGSGSVKTPNVQSDSLDLTIAGSGTYEAAGNVGALDMTIAGNGQANMAALTAGTADISIAGSGDAEFASDGNVEATIMGSGTVNVTGNATCDINSMGSGKLNCLKGTAALTSGQDDASAEITQTVTAAEDTTVAPTVPPAPATAPSGDAAVLRAEAEAKRAEAEAARAEAAAVRAEAEAARAEASASGSSQE